MTHGCTPDDTTVPRPRQGAVAHRSRGYRGLLLRWHVLSYRSGCYSSAPFVRDRCARNV